MERRRKERPLIEGGGWRHIHSPFPLLSLSLSTLTLEAEEEGREEEAVVVCAS